MRHWRLIALGALHMVVLMALLLVPPHFVFSQAPVRLPWTAVGSTGVLDPFSAPIQVMNETGVQPTTNSTAKVTLRYNVVNTCEGGTNPSQPPWKTLELGSKADAFGNVKATLYRVTPCNGAAVPIATVSNNAAGPAHCVTSSIASLPVDFSKYLYHVRVELARTSPNGKPTLYTLRIYP